LNDCSDATALIFDALSLKTIALCLLQTVARELSEEQRKGTAYKTSCFSPLLPLGGNPLEFLDETCPAKTREIGLPYGENFIILTSTVFD